MPNAAFRIAAGFGGLAVTMGTAAGCAGAGAGPQSLPVIRSVAAAQVNTSAPPSRKGSPAATGRTAERAAVVNVVRRYYAIVNALHRDMNPDRLGTLFTPRCPCRVQVRAVEVAAARHQRYVDHARLNVIRPSLSGPAHATVLVNLDRTRGGLVAADGTVVTSTPPRRHIERLFSLVYIHRSWLIDRIDAP